jgi:hypothetical protein
MKIKIWYKNNEYHWLMYDSSDEVIKNTGKASSLGEVFEQITRARTINSIQIRDTVSPIIGDLK